MIESEPPLLTARPDQTAVPSMSTLLPFETPVPEWMPEVTMVMVMRGQPWLSERERNRDGHGAYLTPPTHALAGPSRGESVAI